MADFALFQILEKIGLSEKQARVYYAALQLGPTTVSAISRESEVKRSTVYSVIESLGERGLIRKEIHGIKEFLVAAEPEKLEKLLDEQRAALHAVLPQMQALHRLKGHESVIKYYEGIEALKTVYTEMLSLVRLSEDYSILTDSKKWFSLDREFFTSFLEKRSRLNITVKHILSRSFLDVPHLRENRRANERYKFLPEGSEIATNLVIIPRRVFVHSLVPPLIGMVIENQHYFASEQY